MRVDPKKHNIDSAAEIISQDFQAATDGNDQPKSTDSGYSNDAFYTEEHLQQSLPILPDLSKSSTTQTDGPNDIDGPNDPVHEKADIAVAFATVEGING